MIEKEKYVYRHEDVNRESDNVIKKQFPQNYYPTQEVYDWAHVIAYGNRHFNFYMITDDFMESFKYANENPVLRYGFTNYGFYEISDKYLFLLGLTVYGIPVCRIYEIDTDTKEGKILLNIKRPFRYPFKYLLPLAVRKYENVKLMQEEYKYYDVLTLEQENPPIGVFKEYIKTDNLSYSIKVGIGATENTGIPFYTIFTVSQQISNVYNSYQNSALAVVPQILGRKIYISYPYRYEAFNESDNLPFIPFLSLYPVPKKKTHILPNFFIPTFTSTNLVGLMAESSAIAYMSQFSLFTNTYQPVFEDHLNVYMYPSYNYTDFVGAYFITNGITDAPGSRLFTIFSEPKLGLFIAIYENFDERTQQPLITTNYDSWYVSEKPIDRLQQQFPDEYLYMEFPVYTKIQFDVSNATYTYYEPQTQDVIRPILGITKKFTISSINSDDVPHYGGIPILHRVQNAEQLKQLPNFTITKPNPAYIKFVEVDDNDLQIEYLPKGEIPLGLIRGKTIVEDIVESTLKEYSKLKEKPETYTTNGIITIPYLLITIDSDLVVNGKPLWFWVGSMFQKARYLNNLPVYSSEPWHQLSRYALFRFLVTYGLRNTELTYHYRIYYVTYNYEATILNNGNDYSITYNYLEHSLIYENTINSLYTYPSYYYKQRTDENNNVIDEHYFTTSYELIKVEYTKNDGWIESSVLANPNRPVFHIANFKLICESEEFQKSFELLPED